MRELILTMAILMMAACGSIETGGSGMCEPVKQTAPLTKEQCQTCDSVKQDCANPNTVCVGRSVTWVPVSTLCCVPCSRLWAI
jgi:hypothetical protein